MKKYIIAITGASGSIYAVKLIEELLKNGYSIHLVVSDNGAKVLEYETGIKLLNFIEDMKEKYGNITLEDVDNLFSSVASGSFKTDGMIILPCSMSSLGEIAHGVSKNLIGRAADVCIKEKRPLVIVPRETPLSSIHLKNMLILSESGVTILPAMPGFYHKPENLEDVINFVVGKILDTLSIENNLFKKWGN
ncbi:UbiX family flavin prenyltransferase [Desnuesiella massiliensis]|uniref:UbiX family flavin prenyltransferase n=1 Tax=Desnuesiella massiliensis TaxID=1650662 RepID=UPI0006E3CAAF|nr:flavin prenyltransferase UbiX [Desnuesiella massiliensis]